jgi:hypothetical protein
LLAIVIILLALHLSTPVLRGRGRNESRMACFQWRLRKRKIDGDWEMIRQGFVRRIVHFLESSGKMRGELIAPSRFVGVSGVSLDEEPIEFVFAHEATVSPV